MKKFFTLTITSIALLWLGLSTAQAQTPAKGSGMPVYQDTGNPALDAARYSAEKSRWISANPGRYQELLNEQAKNAPVVSESPQKVNAPTPGSPMTAVEANSASQKPVVKPAPTPAPPTEMTLAEFKAFPAERQNFIRENKHIVKIVDANGKVITNY